MTGLPTARTIDLPAPPVPTEPPDVPTAQLLLGAVLSAGSAAVLAAVAHDARYLVMSTMVVLGSVGLAALVRGRARRAHRRAQARTRNTYGRQLDDAVGAAVAAGSRQRQVLTDARPPASSDPPAQFSAPRAREDPAFGTVRVGTGSTPALVRVQVGSATTSHAPAAGDLHAAAAAAVAATTRVIGVPVVVDLRERAVCVVVGPDRRSADLVRAWVAELVATHAADDLAVVVLADPRAGVRTDGWQWPDGWAWLRWLPHTRGRGAGLLGAAGRTVGVHPDDLSHLLGRAAWTVVVDPGGITAGRRRDGQPGTTHLVLARTIDEVEPGADLVAQLHDDGTGRVGTDEVVPDGLTADDAERLARRLVPCLVRVREKRPPSSSGSTGDPVRLRPLLDAVRGDDRGDLALRVPLGVGADGAPTWLDLRESAVGGDGPHGVLVGATGSGKSELLRTLVLGLAARASPAEVALVLVDFKGGATFDPLRALPHVAGLVTNLGDDQAGIGRVQRALEGELVRRQRRLRDLRCDSVRAMRERPHSAALLADEPLPDLVVVVDEFGELLEASPEMLDTFVRTGRVGRSLGLHLLLSSQRLDEGRLRGLESHLGFRIALRTFTVGESAALLGTGAAAELPAVPGVGYLRTADGMQRFRAAITAGVLAHTRHQPGEVVRLLGPWRPSAPTESTPAPDEPATTELDQLVGELCAAGTGAARPVCLPALPELVRLSDLLGHDTGPGIPLGLVDLPHEGRQAPLRLDLLHGGNVAVVGGHRSGRSSLLRTIARSLAARYDPGSVHVVLVAAGATSATEGADHVVSALPHTSAVVDAHDADAVTHLLDELAATIDDRAQPRDAVERMTDGDRGPHVVLLVDDLGRLRRDQPSAEEQLVALAAAGPQTRLVLVVTAARWTDLRPALLDTVGTRLELRVDDAVDSRWPRSVAATLPRGPGAALTPAGDPARLALADGSEPVLAHPDGRRAPRVQVLPTGVHEDAIEPDGDAADAGAGFLLGVSARRGRAVRLDLLADEVHLLVVGDRGSGRTTLLVRIARWLGAQHPDVQLHVVHPRRSLLAVADAPGVCAGATTSSQVGELVAALATTLTATPCPPRPSRHVLLVDDAELLGGGDPLFGSTSPLAPLAQLFPSAADLGLRVVLARRVTGLARAAYDPVLSRMREHATHVLVLSGDRAEGPVVGDVAATRMPPGRGRLVRTFAGPATGELVQCALPARPDGAPQR